MSWFEDWFDSPLYELLYSYRNEDEAQKLARLIERQIPKNKYPRIVDVGCGRGRHSITLAELGYNVTGFDLSPQAIEKARKIAHKRELSNVKFIVNDMRKPLNDRFDAALNLFTTFGYFLDENQNVEVLKNIHSMLKRNGLFLIDFLNAEKTARELKPAEEGEDDGVTYTIERYIEDGFVFKKIKFHGDNPNLQREYTERVRLFDKGWFEDKLSESGFKPIKVWGTYDGKPFDDKHSPRLIILSRAT